MARPTPDVIFEPTRGPERIERACQHSGCPEAGLYRAPKSRDFLSDYYWFCLEHIREYNQAWDYFVGMSEEEIEAQRRVDTVWERPTWPLGADLNRAEAAARAKLDEDFGLGGGTAGGRHKGTGEHSADEKALAVLDLKRPVTFPEIKARYKQLAKRLHPDANGGDTRAEEQLKKVNEAYATLKKSFVQ
jgi:hypothetical protein